MSQSRKTNGEIMEPQWSNDNHSTDTRRRSNQSTKLSNLDLAHSKNMAVYLRDVLETSAEALGVKNGSDGNSGMHVDGVMPKRATARQPNVAANDCGRKRLPLQCSE